MTTTTQKQNNVSRLTIWASAAFAALLITVIASTAHAAWQTPAEAAQLQLAAAEPATAPASVTITQQPNYFAITNDDVAAEVQRQLQHQGFRDGVKAFVNPGSAPVLAQANHPLKLVIHALQVDTDASIWQGQAYIMDGEKTEMVKPVAGRYDTVATVPVLTRQLRKGDVIEQADLEFKKIPERQLRKDSITDAARLIGNSPIRMISPGRAIRAAEISSPMMVKKGQTVEMHYTTPYMTIRTTGQALEDGSDGALVRVQNSTSQKAVSGRVVANGKIEVNSESTL